MAVSSTYSPVLSCVEVAAQPSVDSSRAALTNVRAFIALAFEKKPRLRGGWNRGAASYCASLDPEISMKTWRSGCMQVTFFVLLASLHSAAHVVGWRSPRALVSTRLLSTPWLTR